MIIEIKYTPETVIKVNGIVFDFLDINIHNAIIGCDFYTAKGIFTNGFVKFGINGEYKEFTLPPFPLMPNMKSLENWILELKKIREWVNYTKKHAKGQNKYIFTI